MGVSLISQAEMAGVLRAVHGLPQRAQQHGLQQLFVRAAFEFVEQISVVLGMWIIATGDEEAEFGEEFLQGFQLLRRRAFVYPVKGCVFVAGEKIGGADIGRQHAFLDQPVRVVASGGDDALDLAVLVEQHLGFHRLEVNGAALTTRLQQHLEQLVEVL